jgi:hypothetical protein
LELSEDELFRLMTMAHERDITLNQLVTDVIQRVIDQEALKEIEEELDQYSIITEKKQKKKSKKA